jgi:hypothetical protein
MPSPSSLADLSAEVAVLSDLYRSVADRAEVLRSGRCRTRPDEANARGTASGTTEGGQYHPPQCCALTCSVDYLTMGFPVEHLDRVKLLLEAPLLLRQWEDGPSICGCRVSEQLPDGAIVAWGNPTCPDLGFLSLSGKVLFERYSNQQVQALIRAVRKLGGYATRVDLAVDFKSEFPLVDAVRAAVQRGELTGLRKAEGFAADLRSGLITGIRIGSGGTAGKLLRVYRKDIETGQMFDDGRQWCRWEFQSRHDVAHQVAASIAEHPEESLSSLILSSALGVVDFREPRTWSRALAHRPRVDWWARLLRVVQPVEYVRRREAPSLAGKLEWLGGTVTREVQKLATIAKVPARVVLRFLESRCPAPEDVGRFTLAHEEWAALAPELLRPFRACSPGDVPVPARVVAERPSSLRGSPWLR